MIPNSLRISGFFTESKVSRIFYFYFFLSRLFTNFLSIALRVRARYREEGLDALEVARADVRPRQNQKFL